MILYRLTEDSNRLNLLEGSSISEERYKAIFFTDRCLFEPIQGYERKDMKEYNDESYCVIKNIECMLFYNDKELEMFLCKI